MSDGSSIEWCDASWQPVLGCTRVDHRCDNCYAIGVVHRGMSEQHRGLTKLRPKNASRPGMDWNGTVRLQPDKLSEPLRWKRARRIFVCSLADLFHEKVPFEYVAAVFGVMAACPQHTFLVLTKRPERAHEFFAWASTRSNGEAVMEPDFKCHVHAWETLRSPFERTGWPLPNVHLGVSVSDQKTADDAIPKLLQCPAALHWVSAEPLLGPIDLTQSVAPGWPGQRKPGPRLEWIVVGGESGPRARPCAMEWIDAIIGQCQTAGVPVFCKQLGSVVVSEERTVDDPDDQKFFGLKDRWAWCAGFRNGKGADPEEWPEDMRIRELPEARR
jgi:protein gp37